MSLYERLAGILGNFFQVGGPNGPAWKNNSGSLDARNPGDSAYINVRGLDPVGASDLVTKNYGDANYKSALITTMAGRGSATGSGKIVGLSDGPSQWIDDPGTLAWQQILGDYLPAPGAAGNYSTFGSIDISNYSDLIHARCTGDGSAVVGAALKAGSLPNNAPWIVNLTADYLPKYNAQYPSFGLALSNGLSSGTSLVRGWGAYLNGTTFGLHVTSFTLGGSRASLLSGENGVPPTWWLTDLARFRALYDGTNIHYQMSPGTRGLWYDYFVEAYPGSTLTDYGLFIGNDFSGGGSSWGEMMVYQNNLDSSSVVQQAVTGCTGSGVPVKATVADTSKFRAGDLVSVNGMAGNTAANTGTGTLNFGSAIIVTQINSSTQMTLNATGNGTWTSGGMITLTGR